MKALLLTCALTFVAAATLAAVQSSGKQSVELDNVPSAVLDLLSKHSPGFQPEAAEYEVRDGRVYYDIEGPGPDGREVEFDLTRIDGAWTVVETQRDIEPGAAPAAVQGQLKKEFPNFRPRRLIESDQGSGIIIYEYFGPAADGSDTKIEVRYEAGEAEILEEEWVH